MGNLVNWAVCPIFALRSSIVMLTVGMVVWLALVPVIEAAEQTILQRSIPFERQGRVFGFAQLVENAASPLTAFLMAPLAETVLIPLMSDGSGADWVGSWFGTGPERGLALMFTAAGLIGVVVTALAPPVQVGPTGSCLPPRSQPPRDVLWWVALGSRSQEEPAVILPSHRVGSGGTVAAGSSYRLVLQGERNLADAGLGRERTHQFGDHAELVRGVGVGE